MSFQIHEKSQNSTQTETWRKKSELERQKFEKFLWKFDLMMASNVTAEAAETAETAEVAAKIYQKIGSTEKRNIPGRSRKTLDGAATKIK